MTFPNPNYTHIENHIDEYREELNRRRIEQEQARMCTCYKSHHPDALPCPVHGSEEEQR